MELILPYGRGGLTAHLPDGRVAQVLQSGLDRYDAHRTPEQLVEDALAAPVGSPGLAELARGKKNVVLLASDHTRPVPSKLIVPAMLRQVRQGAPDAQITVLIATGCHRGPTRAELEQKFGPELCAQLHIVAHDCASADLADLGTLPSGAPLRVNRLAAQADLLLAEGFIEPHFFAGFSGGRKSVLPGVCGAQTVYANHSAAMIASPYAHSGSLAHNPIHEDMVEGARRAGLRFILNVVCNAQKQVVGAFAGDFEQAHLAGAEFLAGLCRAEAKAPAPLVLTTNNRYPLDQTIYQAVNSMSAAEIICPPGGVIIVAAECEDGHGGEGFYRTFASGRGARQILQDILAVPPERTAPDQWQAQIMARVLAEHTVILVSGQPPELVRGMGLVPAATVEEAVRLADQILGREEPITVIPDGIGTIPCLAAGA